MHILILYQDDDDFLKVKSRFVNVINIFDKLLSAKSSGATNMKKQLEKSIK